MTRHWQDNAAEFGALSKQGYGVRLAVLAACSVQKNKGNPVHKKDAGAGAPARGSSKVSARSFAREAGVADTTVNVHLAAWDKMVKAGWDLDRANLTPQDAETLTVSKRFIEEFDALPKGGNAAKADKLGISPSAARIVNSSSKALATAIKADPKTARAAKAAIREVETAEAEEALRDRGIEPDLGPKQVTPDGMDLFVEAQRIASRLQGYRNDVKALMTRAEPDQRPGLIKVLADEYIKMGMLLSSYGGVPDDISALEV